MPKNGTEFSRYATAFHEILDGYRTKRALFTKDLIKMGLTLEDTDTIDKMFPTITNEKGISFFEASKYSQLIKYYHGRNDLTQLLPKLETEFDSEFQERYSEELQDYDYSKLIEFAKKFELDINEDDIDIVSGAIAEYYSSLIKRAAAKKKTKSKTSIDTQKSEGNNIALSYTITETEKKASVKLCELIKPALQKLKQQTDIICNKQHELKKLNNSKDDKSWVPHLEFEIRSSEKRFNEEFAKLKKLCTDLVILLKPKTDMDTEFPKLISFANNIGNDEYKITCPEEFKYNPFKLMISNFNDCIERSLRVIDKL